MHQIKTLTKQSILYRIERKLEKGRVKRYMTIRDEIIAFLRASMKDKGEDSKNRLKAAELLRKFQEGEMEGQETAIRVEIEHL